MLLASGEAGIGKTALVEHLKQEAAGYDIRILTGTCYDLPPTAPYALWLDIFETISQRAFDAQQLARIFSDLSRNGPPLLLVLEDLHWADPESLLLLRNLGREIRGEAILIVATHRDDEVATELPLAQVLPHLVRESQAERLHLKPLDQHAVRALLIDRYGLSERHTRRLVDELLVRSEGNPFFIREILHLLEDEGVLIRESNGWHLGDIRQPAVPAILQSMMERRLLPLDPEVRRLLEFAAVIGTEISVRLWQVVAEVTDEQLDQTILAAAEAGILTESSRDGYLYFVHALMGEALLQRLPISLRQRRHQRIAELLLKESDPGPDAVARHLLLAEDPRAAGWLIRAGREASSIGAHQVAAERFERAIPLLGSGVASANERGWLLCELAEARRYSDTYQALRCAEQAISIAVDASSSDQALAVLARLIHARIRGFRDEAALDALRAAMAEYDALPPDEQIRIAESPLHYVTNLGTYAQWLAIHGRYTDALTVADRYLNQSHNDANDQQTIGHAWYAAALSNAALGQPERARTAFARARSRYSEAQNPHMLGMMLDWELDTVVCIYAADQPAERVSVIQELHQLDQNTISAAQQFSADLLDGRWAEVRATAEATSGLDALKIFRARVLSELDWRQGFAERSWQHIHQIFQEGPATEPGRRLFHNLLNIQHIAAELALDADEPQIALSWIEASERWLDWSGNTAWRPRIQLLRARCAEMAGDRDEARRLAYAAFELSSSPRQALLLIESQLILGRLSMTSGQSDDAGKRFAAAEVLAEQCSAPWEIARCKIAQAQHCIASGELDAARPFLDAAHAIALRLEAHPLIEQIDALLANDSMAVAVTTAPAGLSRREVEVLGLVAQGHSNASVADKLFISPRTVEQHLRRIYPKIGVRSRTGATRFAIEHDIS